MGRLPWSGQREEVTMRHVQVFDVNETLLDLAAMDPHFEQVFGDAGARVTWFNQMIQSALVATTTGVYSQFGALAMAALEMTAEQAGVELGDDDRQAIAAQMRQLPAHPEVADALRRLRDAGLRLAALTNSTEEVARSQLKHAGLIDLFDLVLSADTVRRLKPAPEPYRVAAEQLGVAVGEVRLIAAHAWDVAGAAGPAAPPRSSRGPARCWTRWWSGPRSSAPIWSRSPTPSSPSRATPTGCPEPSMA
jgi:2-haloacid dehalogenase